MSAAGHTPGPWTAKHTSGAGLSVHADVSKALGPRYSTDCPVYHLGNDACTMNIAYELWTQFPRAEWDAMQEANAHLIAAAPELLEALADLELSANTVAGCYTRNPGNFAAALRDLCESAEKARAAIARATAQQPTGGA